MIRRHPADRIHDMACPCTECSGIHTVRTRHGQKPKHVVRINHAVLGLIAGVLVMSAYSAFAAQPSIVDLTIGARP